MYLRKLQFALRGMAAAALVTSAAIVSAVPAQAQNGPLKFIFSGGNAGGTFGIVVAAIVERLKQDHPDAQVDITPGGSMANTIRLARGDQSMSMLTSLLPYRAFEGTLAPDQLPEPAKELRGVARIYNMHSQFIVPADSEIKTFDEVVQNKMKIRIVPGGPRGNVGVTVMEDLLRDAYGLTLEDMENWGASLTFADYNQGAQMMKDGQVDMLMTLTAAPNGAFLDLANSMDVRFLPLQGAPAESMVSDGYVLADMPAGTYPGQDEPVPSVSLTASIYARDDAPPGTVRAVAQTILENKDYMSSIHRRIKEDFDPATAFEGMGVPLHPEAEAVYRELGYIK